MPHNFDDSNSKGKKGEKFLDKFFAPRYVITEATKAEQWTEIDRWYVNRKTGHRFSVEYKYDEQAGRYGNAFIETESNHESGRRGWIYTSEAEYLIYYIPDPETIYVVRFEDLRRRFEAWKHTYPEKTVPNKEQHREFTTIGVPVPLHEFERCAVLVI